MSDNKGPTMYTALDAKSKAVAKTLAESTSSTWAAAEAKKAQTIVIGFYKDGLMDDDEFNNAMTWLGNHSACRQWATQHGLLKTPDDAMSGAVKRELAVIMQNAQ